MKKEKKKRKTQSCKDVSRLQYLPVKELFASSGDVLCSIFQVILLTLDRLLRPPCGCSLVAVVIVDCGSSAEVPSIYIRYWAQSTTYLCIRYLQEVCAMYSGSAMDFVSASHVNT